MILVKVSTVFSAASQIEGYIDVQTAIAAVAQLALKHRENENFVKASSYLLLHRWTVRGRMSN